MTNKEKLYQTLLATTDISLLKKYSENPNRDIKAAVTLSPNTPSEDLIWLSCDVTLVRANVAKNPNTPTKILQKLTQDSSW